MDAWMRLQRQYTSKTEYYIYNTDCFKYLLSSKLFVNFECFGPVFEKQVFPKSIEENAVIGLQVHQEIDQVDIFSVDTKLFSQPGSCNGNAVHRLIGNGRNVFG